MAITTNNIVRLAEGTTALNEFGDPTEKTIKFLVTDPTATVDTALEAVRQVAAGITISGLRFSGVRFESFTGDDFIEISAMYKTPSDDKGYDEETPTMNWSCGGGTKHVTRAIKQTHPYGQKDAGGAIGWNGKYGDESQIEGVDIPTANHKMTYTKVIPINALTAQYRIAVGNLVGKVNSAQFKGWPKGSVMFDGANYSTPIKKRIKVVVAFDFHMQPNEENVVLGKDDNNQDITVSAEGFEYVDVRHKTTVNPQNNTPRVKIEDVYVDQVTHYGDFSILGLGS